MHVSGTPAFEPNPLRATVSAIADESWPLVRVYLLFAWLGGLAVLLAMPPLAIWDERTHWLRAVELSQGTVFPREFSNGWPISRVPESVVTFINTDINAQPERVVTWAWYAEELRKPLAPEKTTSGVQWATTPCCYLVYLPQALGIALARAVGGGPLAMFWAGRLAALLVSSLVIAAGLRLATTGRAVLLFVALWPSTLSLCVSHNADAMFLAVALHLCARLLRLAQLGSVQFTVREAAIVAGLALFLGVCRFPFVLLPACVLPLAFTGPVRSARWWFMGLMIAALGLTLCWTLVAKRLVPEKHSAPGYECDPAAQTRFVRRHPDKALWVIGTGVLTQSADLLLRLTHWPCRVYRYEPLLMSLLPLAWLVLLWLVDRPPPETSARRGIAVATLLTMVTITGLIGLGIYLWWCPVEGTTLAGLQPRYFLPFVPLGGLWFPRLPVVWVGSSRLLLRSTLAVSLTVFVMGFVGLVTEYW